MMAINGTRRTVGFLGLLTLFFAALKLLGKMPLSWWWALSPIWLPVGVIITILLIVLALLLVVRYLADLSRALRRRKTKDAN